MAIKVAVKNRSKIVVAYILSIRFSANTMYDFSRKNVVEEAVILIIENARVLCCIYTVSGSDVIILVYLKDIF